MAFFPAAANFMPLQTHLGTHHPQHQQHHDQSTELPPHHQHPPIFPANNGTNCPSHHHFHGVPMMGLNMTSNGGGGGCGGSGDDINNMMEQEPELSSDEGSQAGGDLNLMMLKKRRLNMDQVRTLEKNFELGNKLEPERKLQLARTLGLQPRQIAIWFQNRRARWKTKQLEKDYDLLKSQFKAIKADHDALLAQNQKLHAEIMVLKGREVPTESINLNKVETEGSSSNRSESGSEIKLDAASSRGTTPAVDESSPVSTQHSPAVTSCRALFPAPSPALSNNDINNSNSNNNVMMMMMRAPPTPPPPTPPPPPPPSSSSSSSLSAAHLFQMNNNNNSSSSRPDQTIKEESLCNMFCGFDDQSGFWTWLEKHHFN